MEIVCRDATDPQPGGLSWTNREAEREFMALMEALRRRGWRLAWQGVGPDTGRSMVFERDFGEPTSGANR